MELFATNEIVDALQGQLPALQGESRLPAVVELAWHLRQRNCNRALELVEEAQQLGPSPLQKARLNLVRAEIRWVFADLESASALSKEATGLFVQAGDAIGQGDALWMEACLGLDQGNGDYVDDCLVQAAALYRAAGDVARMYAAQARRLVYAAFRDTEDTRKLLLELFADRSQHLPGTAYWIETAHANVAGLTDDPGLSIRHDLEAYRLALESGQMRQALVSVSNAVETFAMLGDLEAALEWCDPALALGRSTGWPGTVGVCLMQMGDVMRLLGRHEEARSYLQESLETMAAISGSRNYEQVLGNLGQLALDTGDFAAGLDWFMQFEQRVSDHHEHDLLIKAWRGQASALVSLGRAQEAHAKAMSALALAQEQGSMDGQIQILVVLAQLHAVADIAPPPDMQTPMRCRSLDM